MNERGRKLNKHSHKSEFHSDFSKLWELGAPLCSTWGWRCCIKFTIVQFSRLECFVCVCLFVSLCLFVCLCVCVCLYSTLHKIHNFSPASCFVCGKYERRRAQMPHTALSADCRNTITNTYTNTPTDTNTNTNTSQKVARRCPIVQSQIETHMDNIHWIWFGNHSWIIFDPCCVIQFPLETGAHKQLILPANQTGQDSSGTMVTTINGCPPGRKRMKIQKSMQHHLQQF